MALIDKSPSANALALAPRTSSGRITDILDGKRGVPGTALRLARYCDNSAQFRLDLQTACAPGDDRRRFLNENESLLD